MTCEDLKDEFELYTLGLSEDPERSEVEEHLRRGCSTCSANLRHALEFNAGILTLVPEVKPSRQLRRRVLASIGSEDSNWGWMAGWGLVLASLTIAAFWFGTQDRQHRRELAEARRLVQERTSDLTRLRQALAILNEPETKHVVFGQGQPQPPRGRVFVHANRGVLLLASNLPPAPEGKTYELWIIPKGGAPRPAGLFQSDPNGTAVYLSEGPVDVAATGAVAVSLEPEAGSQAPTTTPVIVAPVAE